MPNHEEEVCRLLSIQAGAEGGEREGEGREKGRGERRGREREREGREKGRGERREGREKGGMREWSMNGKNHRTQYILSTFD